MGMLLNKLPIYASIVRIGIEKIVLSLYASLTNSKHIKFPIFQVT